MTAVTDGELLLLLQERERREAEELEEGTNV
jgi:hypothetical protein